MRTLDRDNRNVNKADKWEYRGRDKIRNYTTWRHQSQISAVASNVINPKVCRVEALRSIANGVHIARHHRQVARRKH